MRALELASKLQSLKMHPKLTNPSGVQHAMNLPFMGERLPEDLGIKPNILYHKLETLNATLNTLNVTCSQPSLSCKAG